MHIQSPLPHLNHSARHTGYLRVIMLVGVLAHEFGRQFNVIIQKQHHLVLRHQECVIHGPWNRRPFQLVPDYAAICHKRLESGSCSERVFRRLINDKDFTGTIFQRQELGQRIQKDTFSPIGWDCYRNV